MDRIRIEEGEIKRENIRRLGKKALMKRRKGKEEEEAPSACCFYGFRLPSLRDCAGMTGVISARGIFY